VRGFNTCLFLLPTPLSDLSQATTLPLSPSPVTTFPSSGLNCSLFAAIVMADSATSAEHAHEGSALSLAWVLVVLMFAMSTFCIVRWWQGEEAARKKAEAAAAVSSARAEEEAKRARDNAAAGEAARKQAEDSAAEARRLASEANAARSQLEVWAPY
jgi:hypothetical protein